MVNSSSKVRDKMVGYVIVENAVGFSLHLFNPALCSFGLVVAQGGLVNGQLVTFHITNKCPFPIWPAAAPNAGHPVIGDGGFLLPPGQTKRVQAPPTWNGRFWARTGCNFNSTSKPVCQTGDCESLLSCNGTIGMPPATLVEVALQEDKSKPSFYDVSVVDGNSYGKPQKCKASMYSKMFKDACPSYFSYAYDSPPPLVNCYSKDYAITFCPSKWSTHLSM
ncbi:thaumatin-like protein [Cocos nucifera]|nr:thaumatin-like protein [Cocos nucifera]